MKLLTVQGRATDPELDAKCKPAWPRHPLTLKLQNVFYDQPRSLPPGAPFPLLVQQDLPGPRLPGH